MAKVFKNTVRTYFFAILSALLAAEAVGANTCFHNDIAHTSQHHFGEEVVELTVGEID